MPTLEQARAWYTDADPVHDFEHILRVYHMAERLAMEEGADVEIVRAAALLHDAEGSAPGTAERASHHHSSSEFAAEILLQEGWPQDRIAAVQHCILAHRFRRDGDAPQTIEAKVLFDADKLDVLGAIGVARAIAYATLNHQPFYTQPSERFIQTGEREPGEPHSSYHEYLFKLCKIKGLLYSKTAQAIADERDQYLANFFVQLGAELNGEK